ncbi:MAG: hypothetical protein U1F57_01070 [bacterium]
MAASDLRTVSNGQELQQESILTRTALFQGNALSATQAKVDGLVSSAASELASWKGLAALGAFSLASKLGSGLWVAGEGATALEATTVATRASVVTRAAVPAFGSLSLLLAGCGESTDTDNTNPEIPPPSNPPPGTDSVCEDVKSKIQGTTPDASLKSLVDSITFPTLDFTYQGTPIWNDSKGNPISTPVKIGNPVSWAKVGDKLFVVTANKLDNGAFAPATVLVYKVSGTTLTPVETTDILQTTDKKKSNALNLGFYNPSGMAPLTDGTLGILFGAPNVGIVSTVDPVSLTIFESDWCSTHSYDAGAPRPDGGTGGNGGAGGADAGVGGADGGHDAGAGKDAGSDASMDAGHDADAGPKDGGIG